MQPSSRLDRLPPYLFAELERKIREKRAAGVDVISLGIGDPDTPTPQPVIDALAAAASDPGTHQYPSNRGRPELREAFARFYERRFGVTLDPESEVIPALGAKECVFNLNLAFLDPDSVALAADPGYPVYTGGPLLAGAEAVLMPLLPERGFAPDLDAIGGDVAERARLLYLNYPNNPTGAIVPDGLFERAVEFGREHDVLIVHDASYTETTFDGYVAPSFLETPGAKEVGVEVFSLSKGWNMTGWRTAAIVGQRRGRGRLLEAEDEHRLGHVRGGAAGRGGRARRRSAGRDEPDLPAPPRPRLRRARRDRRGRDAAEGHDLRLGAGAGGAHLGVLLRAGARGVGRGRLARRLLRPERRGLLPHLAHRARRAPGRGRGAPAREPRGIGVHYCGIVPMQHTLQLAMLEEVRAPEPPIRLSAIFFEPGSADQVAAELRSLGEVVVAVGAPLSGRQPELERRGVPPQPESPEAARLVELLGLPGVHARARMRTRAWWTRARTTTSPCSRRTPTASSARSRAGGCPAKRHPYGMQLRIEELLGDRVTDEGGDLWHRRIEELDAAACALCAHRYAVGHASWLGRRRPPGQRPPGDVPKRGRDAAGGAAPAPGRGHRIGRVSWIGCPRWTPR